MGTLPNQTEASGGYVPFSSDLQPEVQVFDINTLGRMAQTTAATPNAKLIDDKEKSTAATNAKKIEAPDAWAGTKTEHESTPQGQSTAEQTQGQQAQGQNKETADKSNAATLDNTPVTLAGILDMSKRGQLSEWLHGTDPKDGHHMEEEEVRRKLYEAVKQAEVTTLSILRPETRASVQFDLKDVESALTMGSVDDIAQKLQKLQADAQVPPTPDEVKKADKEQDLPMAALAMLLFESSTPMTDAASTMQTSSLNDLKLLPTGHGKVHHNQQQQSKTHSIT